MSELQELRDQLVKAAAYIEHLEQQVEEKDNHLAAIEKQAEAHQIAAELIDRGSIEPEQFEEKAAELVEASDEDRAITRRAMEMFGGSPDMGKLAETLDPTSRLSGDPDAQRAMRRQQFYENMGI